MTNTEKELARQIHELGKEVKELREALIMCLDGLQTYAPDFMHGLPKKAYVKKAEKALHA